MQAHTGREAQLFEVGSLYRIQDIAWTLQLVS